MNSNATPTPTPAQPLEPTIRRPTQCRICGKTFEGNSLQTAAHLINANDHVKTQHVNALLSPFMKHLAKQHAQHLQYTQLQGGQFAGLLALSYFQCDDPVIEQSRDQTRWQIHNQTRRAVVTDERIAERVKLAFINAAMIEGGLEPVKQCGDAPPQIADKATAFGRSQLAKTIIDTMMQMRDVIEERGRYTPQPAPQNEPLSTPAS